MKILGAFDSPNSITSHSNKFSIRYQHKFEFRGSQSWKILELQPIDLTSPEIVGTGNLYLTVILWMARLSIHKRLEPSFLGASRAGMTHGLRLGCMRL